MSKIFFVTVCLNTRSVRYDMSKKHFFFAHYKCICLQSALLKYDIVKTVQISPPKSDFPGQQSWFILPNMNKSV